MKSALILALGLACAIGANAQSHYRSGYVTKDGTYVSPSYATNPNGTRLDNYSAKGNYNPYTGKAGTVDPYATPKSYYQAPRPKKSRDLYGND